MLSKLLKCVLIIMLWQPYMAFAQLLSLSIKSNTGISSLSFDQSNSSAAITGGSSVSDVSFSFSKGLLGILGTGVLPKVTLKALQTNFTYKPPSASTSVTGGAANIVPANIITAQITDVSGSDAVTGLLSSILSSSRPVILSNTEQPMFDGLANISLNLFGSDRPVTVKYSITPAGIQQLLKAAGTYIIDLLYTSYNAANSSNGTANVTLSIQVLPFTTITGLTDVPRLKFTQADDYKNGPQSAPAQQVFTITSTVPYQLKLKTGYSVFSDQQGVNQRAMLVSHIKTQAGLSGGKVTALPALTTADNTILYGDNALQSTESIVYGMPAQYTGNYMAPGVYSTPVTYTVTNSAGFTQTVTANLNIEVAAIAQLAVNGMVDLKFLTADDYRNGIRVDITNHLHIDKNTPYDISVKAANTYLQGNGTSIPLDGLIRIEPITTGSTLSGNLGRIKLSPGYQAIILGGGPDINKDISIRYSISAADAEKLLNKPAGVYSTTITYSFTAQ